MEAKKIQMGLLVSVLVLGLLSSCAVVRSFQKSYLRDSEMILSPRQVQSMVLVNSFSMRCLSLKNIFFI